MIVDPRRFGTGELLLGSDALEAFFAARLGVEPFEEGFTAGHLRALAQGGRAPVKAMLLDQRKIAGVGNIYADEALFRAGMHPLRQAGTREPLAVGRRPEGRASRRCSAGIDARGATIDDFRHVDGLSGSFQNQFLVHLREGEPCGVCGNDDREDLGGGRGPTCASTASRRRGDGGRSGREQLVELAALGGRLHLVEAPEELGPGRSPAGKLIIPVIRTSSARPSGSFARLISSYSTPAGLSRPFARAQKEHGSVVYTVTALITS